MAVAKEVLTFMVILKIAAGMIQVRLKADPVRLDIVPVGYFCATNQMSKGILDEILAGLPYFITPQGNVFIGATGLVYLGD
jgi:hypothetical protein